MAGKRCSTRGCPAIITTGTKCKRHAKEASASRGTTAERGYGSKHMALRAQWKTLINQGGVTCARCGKSIEPGGPFDLGHTDDRMSYNGPEHQHCNRSAGGRAAHPT